MAGNKEGKAMGERRKASLTDGVKSVSVDGVTELARWFVSGVPRAQVPPPFRILPHSIAIYSGKG